MHSHQENDLDDDELEPFYHRDENGALTWTEAGLQTYRRRFARFRMRIEDLQTFEDYRTAMHLSASVFVEDTLEQWAERVRGPPWRELLEAALTGDAAAIAWARRRDETRKKRRVISPGG